MKTIPFQDLKATNAHNLAAYTKAAKDVVRSGRYINGACLKAFEQEMQNIFGVRHCVGVSTGLDALRLILLAYKDSGKLKDGDEIIIPANTFIATFLAVTHCGLTAVAADVDPVTFCLDFNSLPLSDKTKAIIPVHLYGYPCWNAKILNEVHKRGILVIEDNAQAIGAISPEEGFNGSRQTGNLGDAAAISFYPAKNVGAFGDAGAVLTNSDSLAKTVRMLANYGSETKYIHTLCGFNCRMDEIQAAMLSVKLRYLEEISEHRRRNASLYDKYITNPEVPKPQIPENTTHVWHQYVIRHPRRNDLRAYLKSNGIDTEIHYPVPCHRQPCYVSEVNSTAVALLKTPVNLNICEHLCEEILSLPIADVSSSDIEYIAEIINRYDAKKE